MSEDAVRRGLAKMNLGRRDLAQESWTTSPPLLGKPWILDVDTTVKPLFGHQEGAVVGYNPASRPPRTTHSYLIANLRWCWMSRCMTGTRLLEARCAGPVGMLDRLGREVGRALRGDVGWGNEAVMSEAEQRGLDYLSGCA